MDKQSPITEHPAYYCFRQEAIAWSDPNLLLLVSTLEGSDLSNTLSNEFDGLSTITSLDELLQLSAERFEQRSLILIDAAGVDGQQLPHMIALARDRMGGRMVLWSERLSLSQALSLGLRRLRGTPGLYVFDLNDYKQVPDWFNADHFAHPERWDPRQ